MITLNKLNTAELPAELRLIKVLDELAPESGQLYLPANELCKKIQLSETSTRRYLTKLKELNVIKISDKIYLNPDVFDLSTFARKIYNNVENKIYH